MELPQLGFIVGFEVRVLPVGSFQLRLESLLLLEPLLLGVPMLLVGRFQLRGQIGKAALETVEPRFQLRPLGMIRAVLLLLSLGLSREFLLLLQAQRQFGLQLITLLMPVLGLLLETIPFGCLLTSAPFELALQFRQLTDHLLFLTGQLQQSLLLPVEACCQLGNTMVSGTETRFQPPLLFAQGPRLALTSLLPEAFSFEVRVGCLQG
jgi:hypothetical protein